MTNKWLPWSVRISEFASIIGLHKNEPFYPTGIEAFLEKSCELNVLLGMERGGPIYARVQ